MALKRVNDHLRDRLLEGVVEPGPIDRAVKALTKDEDERVLEELHGYLDKETK